VVTGHLLSRALTNFRFVNASGQDVSVAIGSDGSKALIYVIGVAAIVNLGYDIRQHISTGWWNIDEVSWAQVPM
jgi:hypothetical protein